MKISSLQTAIFTNVCNDSKLFICLKFCSAGTNDVKSASISVFVDINLSVCK